MLVVERFAQPIARGGVEPAHPLPVGDEPSPRGPAVLAARG